MERPKMTIAALSASCNNGEVVNEQDATRTLRGALAGKSHALIVQAAELAGRLNLGTLDQELCAVFARFFGAGMSADRQCRAKTAVVRALHTLRSTRTDIFVSGMTCYWPERPRSDNADDAAALRIASAVAYAELGSPTEAEELADLLADPVSDVRIAAIRAIVALGAPQRASLLRMRARIVDNNVNVMEECFAGLLECDAERYLPFIAEFMEADDPRLCVVAALSLGRSRLAKALDLLAARWKYVVDRDFRRDLLIAVALLRTEPAISFLLNVLGESDSGADDALIALSHLQMMPNVRDRVSTVVQTAQDPSLDRLFARHF